ncbi:MAG TPA: MlaD family protein [Candidatus Udaeobacter sp.]|jgi:ABC-type transporter Mla subunit MlaD
MKRNLSDYIVALSVILTSLVLLGALTIALSGYHLKKPTRTLQINYEDVTGVKVNSELRYAGAPAGRVLAMRHLTAKERESSPNKRDAVRVTVSLDDGLPPLPADVVATLSSDTLLAPKFVALSAGTPGGNTLANNAAIEGHPAYGLDQITAAAGPLLDNLNVTIANLKNDLGQFTPKLGPLADSLKIDVDNLQNVIKNLDGVSRDADKVLGTADTFIGATDKQLQEQLKQLHVVLLNLKVVTTHAKALVETLAEKPNRLIFSGKPARLTPEAEILKSSKPLPAKSP